MKTNFQKVSEWLVKCGRKVNNKQHLSLQIGVDIEETTELLECFRITNYQEEQKLLLAIELLTDISNNIKDGTTTAYIPNKKRVAALDAICDREFTGNGIAYVSNFKKDSADDEVVRANNSKLENGKPVIMPGGKIGRGSKYISPGLTGFV